MSSLEIHVRDAEIVFEREDGTQRAAANFDIVTGLQLPHSELISITSENMGSDLEYGGANTYEMEFPDEISERLVSFYKQYFAEKPPTEYDCHSFVAYVMGWHDTVDTMASLTRKYEFGPRPVERYEAGAAYAVMSGPDAGAHSLLGTSDPDKNLYIFGVNELMAITTHDATKKLYESENIVQINAKSAHLI